MLDAKSEKKTRHFQVPEAGHVRIGPISAIPALLRDYAAETPDQILAEVGLDSTLFNVPENSIPFSTLGTLLNLCKRRTGISHFGLLVGMHADLESLGQLAQLGMYSRNVGSALRNMIMHLCIHDRGGIPTLSSNHAIATLGYTVYIPVKEGVSQISDGSIAIITHVMRALCGDSWRPDEVRFAHSQPDDIKAYKDFFRSTLRFNVEQTALIFPEHWLHKTIPSADAQLLNGLLKQLVTIENNMQQEIPELIQSTLLPLISSHTCTNSHIADMLSMNERTLNRRLNAKGTNLRAMINEARYESAKQLLAQTNIPVSELAMILGYAETSVFSRAYRRWSGMTAMAWRKQYRV